MKGENNMENDLHVDERLEKQKVAELFAQRGTAASEDVQKQNELVTALVAELVMNTRFIAPVTLSGEGDARQINFHMVKTPQGEPFFPAFTSSEDLEKWEDAKGLQTVQLEFDNYAIMMSNNNTLGGIAINPFSDNFRVDRRIVAQWYERKQMITKGYANNTITKESKYEVYALDPYPSELSDKLCETAKTLPEIKRVWLRGMDLEGKPAYLAVVEMTGEKGVLFPILGEAVRGLLDGRVIHVVEYAPGFPEEAVKDVQPIYSKND